MTWRQTVNNSGVQPLDMRVVVKPDAINDKIGSIIIPDTTREKQEMAAVNGTLVAAGVNAWQEAKARAFDFTKPVPGQRIMFAKYGGVQFKGADGADYRIMNDEDVIGILGDA